jgi:hypothetical protein
LLLLFSFAGAFVVAVVAIVNDIVVVVLFLPVDIVVYPRVLKT